MNARLTSTEKTVLELRKCGMTFADCADKLSISRQGCQKAEKSALAKQGQAESIYHSQHKRDQIEYAAIYLEKGQRVAFAEMRVQDADVAPASWFKVQRQARANKLENVVERLVNDLAAGRASASWTWHRIAGIHQEMARAG